MLRGERADVTDFSYMTLMDTSVVKHNMLKGWERPVRRSWRSPAATGNQTPFYQSSITHHQLSHPCFGLSRIAADSDIDIFGCDIVKFGVWVPTAYIFDYK